MMKAGRNDPCPCGSGKKYKKCCLGKDQAAAERPADPAAVLLSSGEADLVPALPPREARASRPAPPPPPPRNPRQQRFDALWQEFESQDYAGRVAVFLKTIDDPELMDDELAHEMLSVLRPDTIKAGERSRFAELVETLRQRRPEVFEEGAHFYLSWLLQDAVAEGRPELVRALALELAARPARDFDRVHRSLDMLAYHGQLGVLLEAVRVAWPGVKSSSDLLPWAITDLAATGADYEIYDYLERTASPDPADPDLIERIRYFVEDPDLDFVSRFIGDVTGRAARTWTVADFALKPPPRRSRRDWDDDDEEAPAPDEGARNLSRLIAEFVGYLRRAEGVPFPKGELVRDELYRYFLRRHEGSLDPQPSMLERVVYKRTLPKPPPPAHPLCPDRITLDVCLGGLLGMLNCLYHPAAALFEVMPAWLRFLESRGLIDVDRRVKTVEELRPLHVDLLRLWESFTEDPALYRAAQAWPADAAKGLPEPRA